MKYVISSVFNSMCSLIKREHRSVVSFFFANACLENTNNSNQQEWRFFMQSKNMNTFFNIILKVRIISNKKNILNTNQMYIMILGSP